MKVMPDVRISIYKKEFQNMGMIHLRKNCLNLPWNERNARCPYFYPHERILNHGHNSPAEELPKHVFTRRFCEKAA
jgi:hypothetical protein